MMWNWEPLWEALPVIFAVTCVFLTTGTAVFVGIAIVRTLRAAKDYIDSEIPDLVIEKLKRSDADTGDTLSRSDGEVLDVIQEKPKRQLRDS